MKKIFLPLAALLVAAAGALAQTTWEYGYPNLEDVKVTLSVGGDTLYVNGEGKMKNDATVSSLPDWCKGAAASAIKVAIIEDGVTYIGAYAFRSLSNLDSVSIPNSVDTIGQGAFGMCLKLASVPIPGSVTAIMNNAFTGCRSLTSVTLPNSLTFLGTSTFSNCTSITSITIPNGVTTIGVNAFISCTSLTTVTFGSSLLSVESYAFFGCTSLQTLFSYAVTPPSLAGGPFTNSSFATCAMYVPSGAAEAYKGALWKDFGSIVSFDEALFQLQDTVTVRNTAIKTLQTANETLTTNNGKLVSDTVRLYEKVTNLQTENGTLTSNNTQLVSDTVRLYNLAGALQTENGELTANIATLTQQLAECENNGGNTNPTAVNSAQQSFVKLYPNPVVSGQLTVNNEQWNAGEAVEIYSLSGALVATTPTAGEQTSVSVSQLPSGTYIVKVGKYAGKFVRQ